MSLLLLLFVIAAVAVSFAASAAFAAALVYDNIACSVTFSAQAFACHAKAFNVFHFELVSAVGDQVSVVCDLVSALGDGRHAYLCVCLRGPLASRL